MRSISAEGRSKLQQPQLQQAAYCNLDNMVNEDEMQQLLAS